MQLIYVKFNIALKIHFLSLSHAAGGLPLLMLNALMHGYHNWQLYVRAKTLWMKIKKIQTRRLLDAGFTNSSSYLDIPCALELERSTGDV